MDNNAQKNPSNENDLIKGFKNEIKNEEIKNTKDSSNEHHKKQKKDSDSTNCCITCCRGLSFECFQILLELIANLSIILNLIAGIGLTVVENKYKDCKAEIKSKLKLIPIFNYLLVFFSVYIHL